MPMNMGPADRLIRAGIVAPALIVLAIVLGPASVVSVVLFALAAVMLLTSAVSFCPLYAPLGIRTCRRRETT